MKRLNLAVLVPCLLYAGMLLGQTPERRLSANLRYSATRAQTVASTCCFYLHGGAADASLLLVPRLSAVIEMAGQTTGRVDGTSRGLSTVTLLAGPRSSQPVGRFLLAGQALFGAARGFDADFTSGGPKADTATAFGTALGGFAEYRISHALQLRFAQVDYLQTNLPNGADNRQRNIRVGAGLTFALSLPGSRR